MVNYYNLIKDNNDILTLNLLEQFDCNNKNISIEESVMFLNEYFNLSSLNTEHAFIIGFDNQMNIKGVFLISIGNYKKCYFYGRSIASFLLLSGSERFILYHNHPNNNLNFSDDDVNASSNIKILSKMLEIEFIDSVLVTRNGWKCMDRDEGDEFDEYDE